MKGERLLILEKEASRRAFLGLAFRTTGLAASLGALSPHLWGLTRPTAEQRKLARTVYSTIGNITIPVDEDPGWATFEPGITDYSMAVFLKTIFLNGNNDAYDGIIEALNHLNEVPQLLSYNLPFLDMTRGAQEKYLTDILAGQFENDGWQDVLVLAAGLALTSAKMCFFSNYPRHLAKPGAEYQILPPSAIKTGWDIMRLKGPVGPDEERQLRERAKDVEEVPGIDWRNPYI